MISPVYIAGYGSGLIALAATIATIVVIIRSKHHKLPISREWSLQLAFITAFSVAVVIMGVVGAQLDPSVAVGFLTVTGVLALIDWVIVGYVMHKFDEELKHKLVRTPMSPANG